MMDMKEMGIKQIDGGVTAAAGFKAAGVAAGIKYTGRYDMAMVYSETDAVAAATFTSNVVKAAPVKYDMKVVNESENNNLIIKFFIILLITVIIELLIAFIFKTKKLIVIKPIK